MFLAKLVNDAMVKAKVLLLSGYDAPSHRYWRETLSSHLPNYEWTQISLPARYFSWRIRGNAFNFFNHHKDLLEKSYDLLIVTSMVDLNNLRGLLPCLAQIPTILYFHENQFAYPISRDNENEKQNLINAQITSLYSALSADRVLFNSDFNRASFFEGVSNLIKKLPDGILNENLSSIKNKSNVLPVPIYSGKDKRNNINRTTDSNKNEPIKILWNHRWEYDKQPEVFFEAIRILKKDFIDFRLYVVGQSFRVKPTCFNEAKLEFSNEIDHWGYLSREEYEQCLATADIVISSAAHDFQGLSLQEAIISGCIPVAPNRVAYPEYVPKECLYDIFNNGKTLEQTQESGFLAVKISEMIKLIRQNNDLDYIKLTNECRKCLEKYHQENILPHYKHEINRLIDYYHK